MFPVREEEPTERRKEREKWGKQAIRYELSECLRNWGQWEGPPTPIGSQGRKKVRRYRHHRTRPIYRPRFVMIITI